MQASRFLVAALALALLGLAPSMSPASAAKPMAASATTRLAQSVPVSARVGKPGLTAKIVTRPGGKLFLTGIARPKKGPIVIQKATNCNIEAGTCNFKKFAKSKLNKRGRYTTRVYAPRNGSWAWRAQKGDRTSDVWVTCVKRPRASCPTP